MITIEIPGFETLELKHLVMDYNGTLALDGELFEGLEAVLNRLSEKLQLHIITADTFGRVAENIKNVNCRLHIIGKEKQNEQKQQYVESLGFAKVCAIGNGANDGLMLQAAALGIALIQAETAAVKTIMSADLVANSVFDALALFENTKRLLASLRN